MNARHGAHEQRRRLRRGWLIFDVSGFFGALVVNATKIIDRTVTQAQQTTSFETVRLEQGKQEGGYYERHPPRTTVVGALLLAARAALGADAAIGLPPGPPPYGPPPSYGPPPYGPPPDVAVPTLFHFWNGLYIGGSGGWGWTSTKGLNAEGDFGGAQIGYNYQTGNFVFGVEATPQPR